jgi:hypothetical protein
MIYKSTDYERSGVSKRRSVKRRSVGVNAPTFSQPRKEEKMPHDDPKIARLRAALDAAPHDAPAAPAIAIRIVVTIQKKRP